MSVRPVQLVLHYDGTAFAGWQIQPAERTVQGELEKVLASLCGVRVVAQGAGRTDAGVHARGQSVGLEVPAKWQAGTLRRALNALLPPDIWVAAAHEMQPGFHARYDAVSRRYSYSVGVGEATRSPFRRKWEWFCNRPLDVRRLAAAAIELQGAHFFRAFAVRGTAPESDDHKCVITRAQWCEHATGFTFHVVANRFLHHMVRFLVGTMVDIASDRRPLEDMLRLLAADTNDETSPPAPAHALFLEEVVYPPAVYAQVSSR
ncbi:MAG: tRNA pseudouridine(38-40) synthase TruA [Gemmatimonadota bacterium]